MCMRTNGTRRRNKVERPERTSPPEGFADGDVPECSVREHVPPSPYRLTAPPFCAIIDLIFKLFLKGSFESDPMKAVMTEQPAEIINEYMMQMAENLPLFRTLPLSTGLLKNLTPQEMHTIALIGKMGRPKMSELARRGHVTLGTMTVMVSKLVKKGYVNRSREAGDRRVVRVSLTARGRKVDKLHEQFHKDMVDRLMAMLTKEEQWQIVKIVRKITASLG